MGRFTKTESLESVLDRHPKIKRYFSATQEYGFAMCFAIHMLGLNMEVLGLLLGMLRVTEGELAPVSCLQTDASPCQRAGECRTLSVWQGYYDLTRKYFSGITLADLMAVPQGDNYVI